MADFIKGSFTSILELKAGLGPKQKKCCSSKGEYGGCCLNQKCASPETFHWDSFEYTWNESWSPRVSKMCEPTKREGKPVLQMEEDGWFWLSLVARRSEEAQIRFKGAGEIPGGKLPEVEDFWRLQEGGGQTRLGTKNLHGLVFWTWGDRTVGGRGTPLRKANRLDL